MEFPAALDHCRPMQTEQPSFELTERSEQSVLDLVHVWQNFISVDFLMKVMT